MKRNHYSIFITILIAFSFTAVIAHEWMAPEKAAQRQNPIDRSAESIVSGKDIFSELCARCHGNNLEGMAAKKIGIKKDSPDLKKRIKIHSDGDFFWKIQNGKQAQVSLLGLNFYDLIAGSSNDLVNKGFINGAV